MLKKDLWLSHYFPAGVHSYSTPYECVEFPQGMIYTKIPIDQNRLVNQLMLQGFKLIEVSVLFQQQQKISLRENSSIHVDYAQACDELKVADIAKNAFVYSRFHQDPQILPEIAQNIKKDWVGNFFKGQRGDNMIVAYIAGQPVGFMQLIKQTIDLIAVTNTHLCKGIASSMIAFANEQIGLLTAGTQIINKPSVALYQRCGFTLQDSSFVLHKYVS